VLPLFVLEFVMKKYILLLLVFVMAIGSASAFPRKVLVEEATNSGCGPCASAAPTFNAFLENNADNIAIAVYHWNFPSPYDPWYVTIPEILENRIAYYGIAGVPAVVMDGQMRPRADNASGLNSSLNSLLSVSSPIQMEFTSMALYDDSIHVEITVTSAEESIEDDSYYLRLALVEHYRFYTAANGQDDWYHGVLNMVPDETGVPFTIAANSEEIYEFTIPWDESYQWDNLSLTTWVQNDDEWDDTVYQKVFQAEMADFHPDYLFFTEQEDPYHIVDPGSEVEYSLDIMNVGLSEDTYNITVDDSNLPGGWSFSYTTPDGNQTGNSSLLLDVDASYNSTITISSGSNEGETAILSLTFASSANSLVSKRVDFETISSPQVMIVNCDSLGRYDSYYTEALDIYAGEIPISNVTWREYEKAFPGADLANTNIDVVIWMDGNGNPDASEHADDFLAYLNNGGNLFVSGSDFPEILQTEDLLTVMGASYTSPYEPLVPIIGVADDVIGDGLNFDIDGGDGAGNRNIPSTMNATGSGVFGGLYGGNPLRKALIHNDENGKSVIFGFPFEAISTEENRNLVMNRVMSFFELTSDVEEHEVLLGDLPSDFSLAQNYPNPFNPTTEISFNLAASQQVQLVVINMLGEEVSRLIDRSLSAGEHTVSFDASNLTSGIYFYRLMSSHYSETRKMILMK
jgi:thiol-disulfide isomerase/thioredoxin